MRDALEAANKGLSVKHPTYTTLRNNLAELLRNTGRDEEAQPRFLEALSVTCAALGEDHLEYAPNLNSFALLLYITDCHSEALPMMRQALGIHNSTLRPDHPHTKTVRASLETRERDAAPSP